MDLGPSLREAWRLSTRSWPLWLLTIGMGIPFIPSFVMSGGLGGLVGALTRPPRAFDPEWMAQVRALPTGWLIASFVVALAALILTSAITYLIQAALIRGVVIGAERGTVALGEALSLGWRRVISVTLLSLTLGGVTLVIGMLPLLGVALAGRVGGGASAVLLQITQGVSVPISSALGVALYLVILAAVVEDVRPRAAPGRAWAVFRQGWWAFLLVVAVSFVIVLPVVFLMVPIVFAAVPAFAIDLTLGAVVLVLCCGAASLIGVPYLVVTTVFTTALYTLVYRAAAQLADAAAATLSGPAA